MDKRTIIGFALMAVVLVIFSYLSQPSSEEQAAQKHYYDSIQVENAQKELKAKQDSSRVAEASLAQTLGTKVDSTSLFHSSLQGKEENVILENKLVQLTISNRGGYISKALLKKYDNQKREPLVLFGKEDEMMNFEFKYKDGLLSTAIHYFEPVNLTDSSVTMRLKADEKSYIDFIYTIKPDNYMIDFTIQAVGMNGILTPGSDEVTILWKQKLRQVERGFSYENRYSNLTYKLRGDDVDHLSDSKNEDLNVNEQVYWIAYKNQFFSSVLIADKGFTSTELHSRMDSEGSGYLKNFSSEMRTAFDPTGVHPTKMQIYIGPNRYKTLLAYDKHRSGNDKLDLDQLVYLGWPILRWINQVFTINLFDWLSHWGLNMGIVLLLMTLIVKALVFPLTYKSYISSARMRVLKPQIDELAKKYPRKEDAMKKQQETMAIYSKYGVSPMSGCLPMILQIPIWMALFMFVPSAIELRQQKFLWADDLSTYDNLIHWHTHIPLLGTHLSLFCLLMTITNILNTKYSMSQQDTGQQQMPGMKVMMYIMPVMFIFILNDYASGLNYYYFLSSLIGILTIIILRKTVNETKILEQLKEYAATAKPKKKSGLMARLEEMQRQQEETAKQRQQRTNKK